MATTKRTAPAKKGTTKKAAKTVPVEVKAEEVMGVNADGTMEPLTDFAPELKGEAVTVDVEEEVFTDPGPEVEPAPQPVIQMVTPKDPMVKLLYVDSAIPNNQIPIGGGRMITGSGKIFSVALTDFEGTFQTPLTTKLLKERKFIVLSGLDKEQRDQYGVDYKEGEVIKNEGMFDWLLNLPVDKAVEMYTALCQEHRRLAEGRFLDAFEKGDNRLTRDRVEALNAVSKGDYEDGKGALSPIVKALNDAVL